MKKAKTEGRVDVVKQVLDLQVHEYDREFERTSKLDNKIGIIISAYFVFIVFYIPNINIEAIRKLVPTVQSYILVVLVVLIIIVTLISFVFILSTISSREFKSVGINYDEGDFSDKDYYLSYFELYKDVTEENKLINDIKEKYYKLSIYAISVLFALVIINDICLKLWSI